MLPLNPIFRDHRDFLRDARPDVHLRDHANRLVEPSAHLRADLALDQCAGAAPSAAPARNWRIGFRWPIYLRAAAQ
jgi:hypothetical protein